MASPKHAQLFDLDSDLRVHTEVSTSPPHIIDSNHDLPLLEPLGSENDLDLPITLKKGNQKSKSHPLSHFVTFDRMSPSHKSFLTHLNSIKIPQIVFGALDSEE